LAIVSHFHASLIFLGTAYLGRTSLMGRLLTWPAIIILGLKVVTLTNELDYYDTELITAEKSL
jgi:hypothetical protein